ncbi:MAG: hypothetical protein ACR2IK_10295 [Chloroflexota bacterium]
MNTQVVPDQQQLDEMAAAFGAKTQAEFDLVRVVCTDPEAQLATWLHLFGVSEPEPEPTPVGEPS